MEIEETNGSEAALGEIENEGVKNVKSCLQNLYIIWDEFGIEKDVKSHRAKKVWIHILNLLKDILEEEASLHKETIDRIENYKTKIEKLASILSVTPKKIIEAPLLKKEELLHNEFENLCELKNKQIKVYQDLKEVELEYCSILNFPCHNLIHDSGIPTKKDIIEIKDHIKMLKEEKEKRLERLSLMKNELKAIWEATELLPETYIEKNIFEAAETFSLSNETFLSLEEVIGKVQHKKTELEVQKKNLLNRLTALWERLQIDENERKEFLSKHIDYRISTLNSIQQEIKRCEAIKMDRIEQFVYALQKELEDLWSKCHISESNRKVFKNSSITSETLEAYESEIEKYKKYYEDVEHILQKISKREELYNLKTVFENKATDPNRFKNRKGNLLKEEKDRKKIQKDLPLLEFAIIKDIEEYETLNNGKFLYDGKDYKKILANQLNKKTEKNLKHQLQHVALTPKKRPPPTVPKSAPCKLLRSNAGVPLTYTPAAQENKILPRTVAKCVGPHHYKAGSLRKNICKKNQKIVLKERNQSNAVEIKSSPNSTTYGDFAKELNSPVRHFLRSSVLATRKPSGSRISKKCLRKRIASRSSRSNFLNNDTSDYSSLSDGK